MAKKICPSCGKKLNENEEICPSCGYYFSNYDVKIDLDGRPYSEYQESQHNEHYSNYNNNQNSNNININDDDNINEDFLEGYEDDEDYTQTGNISNDTQSNKKNLRIIYSNEDLQNAVKTILGNGKSGTLFVNIFLIIWTSMALFMFISSSRIAGFISIFPLFFVFIGIFIFIKANKTFGSKKSDYNLIDNNNYDAFMDKVKQESAKTNQFIDGRLLYAGSLIAYYHYNDKELTQKYLEIALNKSPTLIFSFRRYFKEIIEDLNMQDDISKLMTNYYIGR